MQPGAANCVMIAFDDARSTQKRDAKSRKFSFTVYRIEIIFFYDKKKKTGEISFENKIRNRFRCEVFRKKIRFSQDLNKSQ